MGLLRRLKPAYSLYHLLNYRKFEPIRRKYAALGVKKKWYSPISHADFVEFPANQNWLDEGNSSTLLPNSQKFKALPANVQNAILPWSDQGYAIIPGLLSDKVSGINEEVDQLIKSGRAKWRYGNKIMFAIDQSALLRQVGKSELVTQILELLLGRQVSLFQSINFIESSEQGTHSDSIHMSTYPLGNLIAAWVALEDISEDCGPLHYYPGSHKLPYLMNENFEHGGNKVMLGKDAYYHYEQRTQDLIKEHGLKKEVFTAQKGDVIIWHANLLHGADTRKNPKATRKSMVFHYFSDSAVCYHEITQRPAILRTY